MRPSVLLVDDEARLGEVVAAALQARDFDTLLAPSVREAMALVHAERIDVVISDMRMPGQGGRELLSAIKRERPELPVIIMTAYASVRSAVDIVKEGAFDYIAKPFEIDDMVATIDRALKLTNAIVENQRLRGEIGGRYSFENLIGASPPFQAALQQVAEVCASRATVLILGESGTGKELVARAIHFNSPRAEKPFLAVNCAAIPEALLESELFGHAKGAFTGAVAARQGRFAAADGGTLFLDEIGDMPGSIQAKVLRVLQDQTFEPVGSDKTVKVDVRIIAATHKDLRGMASAGTFREDLFYRLNVFPITLPPLRERVGDVPLLARRFLRSHADDMAKKIAGFTPAAEDAMNAYAWPGNIRELQNCVERAVIVSHGSLIDVMDLPAYVFESAPREISANGVPADLDGELAIIERDIILEALRNTNGVQVKAAAMLGISERSLWHRVKKLGIKIDAIVGVE